MSLGLRVPNFPISQIVLAHLGWCLLGNWEIGKYVPVLISQFLKSCWAIWAGVFWEIGKLGSMYLYSNSAGPSWLVSFGKLGNWEVCTCTHFPISHFPKSCWAIWAGVFREIGKLIGRDLFVNRGPVYKHSFRALIYFPMLSPYLFANAGCVYKHGFGTLVVTQNVITYVNANTHTDTAVDIG